VEKNITVSDSRRAAIIINGLRAAAKNVFDFYNGYDPLFSRRVPDTYKNLDSSLSLPMLLHLRPATIIIASSNPRAGLKEILLINFIVISFSHLFSGFSKIFGLILIIFSSCHIIYKYSPI